MIGPPMMAGLAELVRWRQVTPRELAQQAAAAIELVNPSLSAVIEIFADKVADPFDEGLDPDGIFAGVPFLMKDLGPTMKGRLQEMGSRLAIGNRPRPTPSSPARCALLVSI